MESYLIELYTIIFWVELIAAIPLSIRKSVQIIRLVKLLRGHSGKAQEMIKSFFPFHTGFLVSWFCITCSMFVNGKAYCSNAYPALAAFGICTLLHLAYLMIWITQRHPTIQK